MCYIGKRRSENSMMAILNDEMPLSRISKSVIHQVVSKRKSLKKEDAENLHNITLQEFRWVCRQMGASSWHHTSNRYIKTDHYDLNKVIDYILYVGIDNVKNAYKRFVEGTKDGK